MKSLFFDRKPFTLPIFALLPFFFLVLGVFFISRSCYFFLLDLPFSANALGTLALGALFDVRWATAISLGVWLCVRLLRFVLNKKVLVSFVHGVTTMVISLLVVLLVLDLYFFLYTGERLNGYIAALAQEQEALLFVWQSYPVMWLLLAFVVVLLVAYALCGAWCNYAKLAFYQRARTWWLAVLQGVCIFLCALPLLWGSFSQYPLRWSDLQQQKIAITKASINPLQNLIDTRKYTPAQVDTSFIQKHLHLFAQQGTLTANEVAKGTFKRTLGNTSTPTTVPPRNLVLIILESFSAFKSSIANNNPIDTTPFLRSLADESLLFTRFLTPHTGTARGVYATLTGLPDIVQATTASRTQATIIKPLLIGQLPKNYHTYYFIGGSASWANIRGLLQANSDIRIFESKDFDSSAIDVWGVSDLDLFRESAARLTHSATPFFAIIQTAGNHAPYTIPEKEMHFVRKQWTDEQIDTAGFVHAKELEAFRLMDYAVRVFFTEMQKSAVFDDTLFVILGDHGINSGKAHGRVPKVWEDYDLTSYHTPLLLYAPKYLTPRVDSKPASQIDLMPTIATFLGTPYESYALGSNLLDVTHDNRVAYFIRHGRLDGLLTDEHLFVAHNNGEHYLYSQTATGQTPTTYELSNDATMQRNLGIFTRLFHDSAQHLLFSGKQETPLR